MEPSSCERTPFFRWADAFTRKDLVAALSAFTDDDDLLVVTATSVLDGRAAVVDYIERYVVGDTTYDWRWRSVRSVLAGDVAWLFAEGTELKCTPGGEREMPYRATVLVRRERDDWRIAQFHGSSPR